MVVPLVLTSEQAYATLIVRLHSARFDSNVECVAEFHTALEIGCGGWCAQFSPSLQCSFVVG